MTTFDRKDWGNRMDQSERELSAALEAAEAAFNDVLPPIHASIAIGTWRKNTFRARLCYGDYKDGKWGIYIPHKDDGLVPIGEADLHYKIQAAGALETLFAAVSATAEREIKDIERATARVLALLKEMSDE